HPRAGGVGAGRVEADLATHPAAAAVASRAADRASHRRRLRASSAPADRPARTSRDAVSAHPKPSDAPRAPRFSTISDMEIAPLYGPEDLPPSDAIGRP